MIKIDSVKAMEILDSRGNPTVAVELKAGDIVSNAMVPSGASTGAHEAVELRDGDESRYNGKGVLNAVNNVNTKISRIVTGMNVTEQKVIDSRMIDLDGTENKRKLGANAVLGVSLAVAKAGAVSEGLELYEYIGKLYGNSKFVLPQPYLNIINGGKHAGNRIDIQEHMIVPKGKTFAESIRMGAEVYHSLKKYLKEKYGKDSTNVGDEGGFAPPMNEAEEPLEAISQVVDELGYDVSIALDCAADSFYKDEKYKLQGKDYSAGELVDFYKELVEKYRIISIEDPFFEEDWEGFAQLTKAIGSKVQIVGDDIFVTNIKRLQNGIDMGACNALLLKVNQIGSVTESLKAAKTAMENRYKVMVSHRSGETEDTFIADLAVGIGCGQIKSGATCRSERTAKYNRLLRIESIIHEKT